LEQKIEMQDSVVPEIYQKFITNYPTMPINTLKGCAAETAFNLRMTLGDFVYD